MLYFVYAFFLSGFKRFLTVFVIFLCVYIEFFRPYSIFFRTPSEHDLGAILKPVLC